jgi:peptidoglycan hydrolase-like protein with peptidoglycan-binding domain
VEAVRRRLRELDYWVGPADGVFGLFTEQAFFAIQKAAGLERDGIALHGYTNVPLMPPPTAASG